MRIHAGVLLAAMLSGGGATASPSCLPDGAANTPAAAPDWRDQVIYFAMIDRFDDGDPANNDQGAGEHDPGKSSHFSGGDLAGLCRRLDYLRGLGATALWITPPVANQWWDGRVRYGGYHGYWAADFMAVDAHFGTLADYRALADGLHARGMSLVQDMVVNHTGNFFSYGSGHDPSDPSAGYAPNGDSRPMTAPLRRPFSLNDPRRAEDRAANIYHWTPVIRDFTDRRQEQDHQLADLDDLNTENPRVRRALRESYGYWIREVGVDAFRIDTAFHVPPAYFRDFLHAEDAVHPGILAVAREAGKPDFHVFGEGFGVDRPYADTLARKIESYTRDDQGPLLPGMINFPLYGGLGDVFARGRPTTELAHRIRSMMTVHADPYRMPTFVDNHDVDRFLAGGSEAGLKQALLALMTLPGIPVIYYGTEQGFRVPRQAMFAGGYGSGGRDHFDTGAPLYRYLADVIALRRSQPLFSRGRPTVLRDAGAGPGVLAWRIDHEGGQALVVFNSADQPRLLDNLDTGLGPGRGLVPAFATEGPVPAAALDRQARLTLVLPPRAGYVWTVAEARDTIADADPPPTLDPVPAGPVEDGLWLSGSAPGVARLQLLLDGEIGSAPVVTPGADGRWRAWLDTAGRVDPDVVHRVVAWDEARGAVSAAHLFRVQPRWRLAAEATDPTGDDTGPSGRYTYPNDEAWRRARPADLRALKAWTSGGALKLELETAQVMADWNPPNGFDHVNFTVFLALPGRPGGVRAMPLQDAELPGDLGWHYRWRLGGWSSAGFSSQGASAENEGEPVAPAPRITVDAAARRITIVFPAAALGRPASLAGARLYVATWDYDGGYRALLPEAGGHQFGGGTPGDPKVMDDSAILVLRPGE